MTGEAKVENSSKTNANGAKPKEAKKNGFGNFFKFGSFFKFDLEYLILIVLVLVIIFGARGYALQISAPVSVSIEESGQFVVDINNDSKEVLNISLSVYSPAKSEVKVPKIIEPNSTAKALVLLKSNGEYGDYVGTIEVKSNGEIVKKEFFLTIEQKKAVSQGNFFGGLFSLGAFVNETGQFSLTEWGFFWILVIVAAILLIAFVARVRRRV